MCSTFKVLILFRNSKVSRSRKTTHKQAHQPFSQNELNSLPKGLQWHEPKTAGQDHQAKGDPPSALPAGGLLRPALCHLRTNHWVTSHPASVEPYQEGGLRAPAGNQSLSERLRNSNNNFFKKRNKSFISQVWNVKGNENLQHLSTELCLPVLTECVLLTCWCFSSLLLRCLLCVKVQHFLSYKMDSTCFG